MAEWSETLHPRGEHGRWTFKGAGGWALDDADKAEVAKFKEMPPWGIRPGSTLESSADMSDDETKAVKNYAGSNASFVLNEALRSSVKLSKTHGATTAGLDSLMERSTLTENVVLYRGYASSFIDQINAMKPGDAFKDPGFMSTSYDAEFTRAAGLGDNVIKILAPAGSQALVVPTTMGHEREVILARGSRLEFVGEDASNKIFRLSQNQISAQRTVGRSSDQGPRPSGSTTVTEEETGRQIEVLINQTNDELVRFAREHDEEDRAKYGKQPITGVVRVMLDESSANLYAWSPEVVHERMEDALLMEPVGDKNRDVWFLVGGKLQSDAVEQIKYQSQIDNGVDPKTPSAIKERQEAARERVQDWIKQGRTNHDLAGVRNTSGAVSNITTSQAKSPSVSLANNVFMQKTSDPTQPQRWAPGKTEDKLTRGFDRAFWLASGTPAEMVEQAKAAVVALGGTEREYAAMVITGGTQEMLPGIADGTQVALIAGERDSVSVPETMLNDLQAIGTFEMHHNHPSPLTLSMPDLSFLNYSKGMLTLHAHTVDGGTSSASLVGRDAEHPDFTHSSGAFNNRLEIYWSAFNDNVTAAVKAVRDDIVSGAHPVGKKSIDRTKDFEDIPMFLLQHAASMGLMNAGVINYKYKFSAQQKAWMTKYEPQYRAIVKVANAKAQTIMKMKTITSKSVLASKWPYS